MDGQCAEIQGMHDRGSRILDEEMRSKRRVDGVSPDPDQDQDQLDHGSWIMHQLVPVYHGHGIH